MSKRTTNKKATVSMKVVDSGKYKAQILKKDKVTGELVLKSESCWSDNIITDAALNAMAGGGAVLTYTGGIQVGSGTTPETASDTSLETPGPSESSGSVASANSYPSTPYTATSTYTYTYDEGAATGTWTEVGKWSGSVGSSVFISRSLFKDGLGDPTSITVLSDEILRIVYQVTRVIPDTDVTATVDGYDLTIRASNIGSIADWKALASGRGARYFLGTDGIGTIDSRPSADYESTTETVRPYVTNSFETITDLYWSTSNANDTSNALAIGWNGDGCNFQVAFDPAIVKTSNDVLDITVKRTYGRPA